MIDIDAARAYYADNDTAHGFDHVLRVWRMAERIGRAEGATMEIVQAAALLHDLGRADEQRTGVCHAQASAARAREILAGQDAHKVEAVCEAIAQHRFRGERGPSTLEAQVLYDADKLDALGALGVARAYAIAGLYHQHLWAEVAEAYAQRAPTAGRADLEANEHTPVHEFRFKLAKLADRLYTPTGRQIAKERHQFMATFFERLEREVRGDA